MVAEPNDRVMTGLRRGVLEYCVLALIAEGESYAFDIVRELGERGLVTSEGTLYPMLSRLRKDGLVSTYWMESEAGPPRRYYKLSEQGGATLRAFTVDWQNFSGAVNALLRTSKKGE